MMNWIETELSSEREPDFYWVLADSTVGLRWQPAEWDGENWWLIGWECEVAEDGIEKVGRAVQRTVPTLDPEHPWNLER